MHGVAAPEHHAARPAHGLDQGWQGLADPVGPVARDERDAAGHVLGIDGVGIEARAVDVQVQVAPGLPALRDNAIASGSG